MSLHGITKQIQTLPEITDAVKCLEAGVSKVVLSGAFGGGKIATLCAVLESLKKTALIITSNHEGAERMHSELKIFLSGENSFPTSSQVYVFKAPDTIPYEKVSPGREVVGERLNILELLTQEKPTIVVAPIKAVMYKTIPKSLFKEAKIELKTGEAQLKRDNILRKLTRLGFKRMEMVGERGEFSVRGGIIDIFPSTMEDPVRVELLGDEIESIRIFDVVSQRSTKSLNMIKILPAREVIITDTAKKKIKTLKQKTYDLERIIEGEYFEGIEYYAPLLFEGERSVFDYLTKEYIIVIDEGIQIKMASERLFDEAGEVRKSEEALSKEKISFSEDPYLSFDEISKIMDERQILETSSISYIEQGKSKEKKVVSINLESPKSYIGRTESLAEDISSKLKEDWSTFILSRQALRIQDILKDYGIEAQYLENADLQIRQIIAVANFELSSGFVLPKLKLEILTDTEIFGEKIVKGRLKVPSKAGIGESILIDLYYGDFVVHSNHGIGTYRGLEKLEIEGTTQEYLLIEYAEGGKLYVPLHQMGLIQKYSSSGDYTPKVNRLGDRSWLRTKEKVKKSIKHMTAELLELYAARSKEKGHAFPPDDLWQAEVEGSFPYDETEDQRKAIVEVKADMEKGKPMERLLCGDVGFGKTEVALRAAFKAATSGKQVAMLVPTTILAQQHFTNFKDRFTPFPIKIEVLSRFKSQKEQRDIIKELEKGIIDIVIGTHRLLQKDVKFKDLGLLIIDEEQRFGVAHKEKLKKLKKTVDVLTLTATPIPRTLYLSLSGARDASMIATPPIDRSPVRTYILEWSDAVIKEAIVRELERNGQVYFVHNSIEDIDKIASHIAKLIPSARITIAHGQMTEGELERTMVEFMAKKFDVLVCTTIIESGIDIPNVNTIIINNAERFGLADLYQLRGRVGRSAAKAYAYLFYNKKRLSTGSALERLEAIREFTSLGSGYKLALRDLEIRGAGNILGREQHGHMMEVGFDLYCELLEDTVREIKGTKETKPQEVMIDVMVNAYIPKDYIKDDRQRIALYRRMNMLDEAQEVDELGKELKDRFGKLPRELHELLKVIYLKVEAKKHNVKSIKEERNRVTIDFSKAPNNEILSKLKRDFGNRISLGKRIILDLRDVGKDKRFGVIKELIGKLG